MNVREVILRRVDMPLDRPYPLSFNQVDMASFDAIVAEVRDGDGRVGRGEVTILPGYTHETVASGLGLWPHPRAGPHRDGHC